MILNKLEQIKESIIGLLDSKNTLWNSLNINYAHPHVHRMYIDISHSRGREAKDGKGITNDYRVYLHKIFPVPPGTEPLFHPHPWESAMEVLEGRYKMGIGHSSDGFETPEEDATIILVPGSQYDMSNEKGWHYVYPLDDAPVYSIMITGKMFPNPITNEVWESIEKDLKPLTYGEKQEMLNKFKELLKK